jgi:hypothetical protein
VHEAIRASEIGCDQAKLAKSSKLEIAVDYILPSASYYNSLVHYYTRSCAALIFFLLPLQAVRRDVPRNMSARTRLSFLIFDCTASEPNTVTESDVSSYNSHPLFFSNTTSYWSEITVQTREQINKNTFSSVLD